MKKLSELLEGLDFEVFSGDFDSHESDLEITQVVYDTRKICEGCLFICLKGANFDSHEKAAWALENGAAALIIERDLPELKGTKGIVLKCDDTRHALSLVSHSFFGHPERRMTTIGVTGTKGKTTTTYLIKSILEAAGHKVGLIGTIETIYGDKRIPSLNTTPESYILAEYFSRMVDEGVDTVVMEVSSQALKMHRTDGILFDYGIFTNIEPDHIGPNEHESFEDYLYCKSLLFSHCKVGVVNGDDPHLKEILKGHTCEVIEFGFGAEDYSASNETLYREGSELGVSFHLSGKEEMDLTVATPGRFSIYNALAAGALALEMGVPKDALKSALKSTHVRGRVEPVKVSDDFILLIDYAHNAMALQSLLQALRDYEPHRIVAVFGCGGNRSKLRRFEMGEVSGKYADFTIITSDNPRYEDPEAIMDDIEVGIKRTASDEKYIRITDRKEAIRHAILNGEGGDIIVLAGKGHEDYQEIEGVKHHMDERDLISEVLLEEGALDSEGNLRRNWLKDR
ncbi:MAG: UDP-N-acetylmuramoyl-L-alanyl-D-glutamate--2,6-diaminopimelate ligase [Lachnospiraceae bacterium]|nr:UDP-N-acetylmuramoyl-L-alanyl-D-glutamate--2,6-diaminopimelate ligase [Lachnospiraceae bacterium]